MPNPLSLSIFALIVALILNANALACTIVSVVGVDGQVWNANNEDSRQKTSELFLNVFPKTDSQQLGFITLTYDQPDSADVQGGMNEAGLTFDFNALGRDYPSIETAGKRAFPTTDDKVLPYILGHFKTVEEVVDFLNSHRFKSPEVFTNCQMHLADRNGNFAIVCPTGSRILSDKTSQVSTNFNLCNASDNYDCQRFSTATKMLAAKPATIASLTDICSATSQQGRFNTLYSNVQNLSTGDIWIYHNRKFKEPFRTNIRDLVTSGRRSWRIRDLCDGTQIPAQHLAARLPELIRDYRIPTVAVAFVDPAIASPVTFVVNESAVTQKANNQSIFNLASLTKPVFATMVFRLVADGKLGLDDDLVDFWVDPDIVDNNWARKLTPRILLSHQSGFPNWRSGKLAFEFEPGTRTQYSGEGMDYLRKAIERKTSRDMKSLMKTYVVGPAKMDDTYFGWNASFEPRFVTGTKNRPGQTPSPVNVTELKKRGPSGAGSMFSTIGDYAKFLQWFLNELKLPKPLSNEIQTQQGPKSNAGELIGLGWHLIAANGRTMAYHEGREDGIYNLCVMDMPAQRAVLILTNSDNGALAAERVVEKTLPNGRAFVHKKRSLIFNLVSNLNAGELSGVASAIASSPSYTNSLCHGFALAAKPSLNKDGNKELEQLFDSFAVDMIRGRITAQSCRELVRQIATRSSKSQELNTKDLDWLTAKMNECLPSKAETP